MFDTFTIIQTYGYIGMFAISFLESGIFPILPGDSLLFTAGILSSQNYLNFYLTVFVFFIGSFLGSLVGYFIGDKLEDFRRNKYTKSYFQKIFKDKYFSEAEEYFKKRGDITILLCKFVPIVRTFAPVLAGGVKMNYKKFVIYNFFGSLLWSISFVSLGNFLGKEFPWMVTYLEYVIAFILIVTIFPVVFEIYRKHKRSVKNKK